MLRTAVVGTSNIAREVLPILEKLPEFSIEVLCSTPHSRQAAKELAASYHIPHVFTDYTAMLADKTICDKIDLIYLPVPNHLHYEMAMQALEAGKHVFLEKPFTPTVKQAEVLFKKAEEKNLFLVEAISNQYLPAFKVLKERISQLGELSFALCEFSQYSRRIDRFMDGEYFRVFDPACDGGVWMDLTVYCAHVIGSLFGIPQSAQYYPNIRKGIDTSGIAILQYPGFQATCLGAKDCPGPSRVLIEGRKGYLELKTEISHFEGPLYHFHQDTRTLEVIETQDPPHRLIPEFQAIEKMIREGDRKWYQEQKEETLTVCRILEMVRASV